MSDTFHAYPEAPPRRKKKNAYIVRAEVTAVQPEDADAVEVYGEAWAAIGEDGLLITCGPDVASVTQAARFAGFWIADQTDDAA
jgi:hypothetical protein